MKVSILFYCFVFICVSSFCCKSPVPKTIVLEAKSNEHEFVKILPLGNRPGKFNYYYTLVQSITRQLNWSVIENGVDSICIRLWYIYRNEMEVVEFINSEGNWSANFFTLGEKPINDSVQDKPHSIDEMITYHFVIKSFSKGTKIRLEQITKQPLWVRSFNPTQRC